MSIHGPRDIGPIRGLERSHNDEEKRRRRSTCHGHSWSEGEDDLPLSPSLPMPSERAVKGRGEVYANKELLERGLSLLERFLTLEEKIAQLCFLTTGALYDRDKELGIEILLQRFGLGGVLFDQGEFRRQTYLTERYQSLVKVPLLIGNTFLHGLSFYFQGDRIALEGMSEKKLRDLGKAVAIQNRHAGVHIQFENALGQLSTPQARAFRQGVREARGIVARTRTFVPEPLGKMVFSGGPFHIKLDTGLESVHEALGLRTLYIYDMENAHTIPHLSYDALLVTPENFPSHLQAFLEAFRSHKLLEADLDKRLLKMLIMKLSAFPQGF